MHVMVDIETMGTAPNAAMLSIGAVKYNDDGSEWDTFYRAIDLSSSIKEGGVMDPSTVLWWMGQSDEARSAFLGSSRVPIREALLDFSLFFPENGLFWGFGATFDNVIVRGAMNRCNLIAPWSYRNDRCFRTLQAMYPDVKPDETGGTFHNALDDAIFQARHHIKILQHGTLQQSNSRQS